MCMILTLGFTKHMSVTTPASLSEEADDVPDAVMPITATTAAGLRRSFTTDDSIMTSHRAQIFSASV